MHAILFFIFLPLFVLANPLELSLDTPELKEGSSTPLHVKGIDTHTNLKWNISNPQLVSITNNTLNALKEGSVSLSLSSDNAQSNTLHVTVYKEIHGHKLPPEPDEKINNSTLLGIDSNNNGVRDDVERWIYEKYKDKHPIHVDIAMQAGRAYKKVLETPERAREIRAEVNSATTCQAYYKYSAKYYNEPILIQRNAVDEYFRETIYYNTKERMDAYNKYDSLLSGGVYTLPSPEEEKAACDFNTSKYEK